MNASEWLTVIGIAAFMLVFGMAIGMELEHKRHKKQSACQHTRLQTYCVECHKEITNE